MNNPLITSMDVVRDAIKDRVHEFGGDDAAIDDIAMSATYAMWCTAFCTTTTS